ncbi:uncharacterized protein EV420DRAFT_1684796 [Desarmillaria tabescens]|uniref:Uncharacterized protein n=1 Tax=Armillaria tabescens TaxID=1929756 RepID=A0AA39NLM5_ARMTA|nr:uncharacterized protein EV420DRAFT_1684796 [Desarmillaria tabescens]KAK0467912.1 hypothetical protein EV420DRAFT_1684796 [Desarmillaria tabescens]
MTKPTLVQTLLGRPSQTYSFPQDKHYYSSKAQLLRLAEGGGGQDRYSREPHDEEKRKRKRSAGHSQSMNVTRTEVTHKSNNDNITNLDASPLSSVTPQQQPSVVVLNDTTSDEDDDDEHDIFYTPNSSPSASMASSVVAILPLPANAKASRPAKTEIAIAVPSTRTPASRSTTSLSSTVATSLDGHSLFSAESNPMSESTRLTTPFTSDSGHEPPRRMVRSKSPHTKRSYTYTDEDWAKDVRWLVMPEGKSTRSTKTPLPRTKPNNVNMSRSQRSTPSSPPRNHSISHAAKVTPSIMMSMTALLEEDEDRDGRLSRLVQMHENPRSSVLISHPRNRTRRPF